MEDYSCPTAKGATVTYLNQLGSGPQFVPEDRTCQGCGKKLHHYGRDHLLCYQCEERAVLATLPTPVIDTLPANLEPEDLRHILISNFGAVEYASLAMGKQRTYLSAYVNGYRPITDNLRDLVNRALTEKWG